MYEYRAKVIKVYDGDTITADVELGFYQLRQKLTIRLADIDAPELRGAERKQGLKARDWLREQVLDRRVILRTRKDRQGKYGRWLADVFVGDGEDQRHINADIVAAGHAQWKLY